MQVPVRAEPQRPALAKERRPPPGRIPGLPGAPDWPAPRGASQRSGAPCYLPPPLPRSAVIVRPFPAARRPPPVKHRIVRTPPRGSWGDCFFHVLSHFLGGGIDDPGNALEVRRALARAAAKALFQPPYDDLGTLTTLVMSSREEDDLAVVALKGGTAALQAAFTDGPFADEGNGGGCPLPAWVVWLQFSYDEVQELRHGKEAGWLRGGHRFLAYTLWGESIFCDALIPGVFGLQPRWYTEDTVGEVDEVEEGVANFYHTQNHFDAVEFAEDDDESGEEAPPAVLPPGPMPNGKNLCVEIHHLDVGQGDSTLVLVKYDAQLQYSILVDGGDSGQAPLIHEYLNRAGVRSLDTLCITHYDKDHVRGVLELLAHSPICQNAAVFDRGETGDVDLDKKLVNVIDRGKAPDGKDAMIEEDRLFASEEEELHHLLAETAKRRVTAGRRGKEVVGEMLLSIGPEHAPVLTFQCVAGNGYLLGGGYVEPLHSDRENAMSLGFLLRFKEFAYFMGGDAPGVRANDLEGAIGECLTGHLGLGHVCAVHVSHHGSHHSTRDTYIGTIEPTCAFVSAGVNRKFQHPRQEPIDVLQGAKSVQNFYMTCCAYERAHLTPPGRVQEGKARVAGDESTLGTIVLRVDESMTWYHVFHVGYWDRETQAWRVMRHCCGNAEIAEEVGFVMDEPEDLAVTSCPLEEPATFIQESVELADAVERARARDDEARVRGLAVRDREGGVRCLLDGSESPEEYEAKTEETQEMLAVLDARYDEEMRMHEDAAYDDDSPYEEDDDP